MININNYNIDNLKTNLLVRKNSDTQIPFKYSHERQIQIIMSINIIAKTNNEQINYKIFEYLMIIFIFVGKFIFFYTKSLFFQFVYIVLYSFIYNDINQIRFVYIFM